MLNDLSSTNHFPLHFKILHMTVSSIAAHCSCFHDFLSGLVDMSASKSATEKALKYLRKAPRLDVWNLRGNPGWKTQGRMVRSKDNKAGKTHKELERAAKPPLGWIWGDFFQPWMRRVPSEAFYNKDIHLRREYPPLSLLELQRMIDLGWIDVSQPIDLATLCNTRQFSCNPVIRQFGVQLTDEGSDVFCARVNVEVQWASELAVATVERRGGSITTAYFDPCSLEALVDPPRFFDKGLPIPKRRFPPADIIDYYTDAKCRGYLANPSLVASHRQELAQKYGYSLPEHRTDNSDDGLMTLRKDPLQIFYGLEPGWVVNLKDKVILKPKDPALMEYYDQIVQ